MPYTRETGRYENNTGQYKIAISRKAFSNLGSKWLQHEMQFPYFQSHGLHDNIWLASSLLYRFLGCRSFCFMLWCGQRVLLRCLLAVSIYVLFYNTCWRITFCSCYVCRRPLGFKLSYNERRPWKYYKRQATTVLNARRALCTNKRAKEIGKGNKRNNEINKQT